MKADERWRPVSQKPEQEVFDENYVDSAAASLSLSPHSASMRVTMMPSMTIKNAEVYIDENNANV